MKIANLLMISVTLVASLGVLVQPVVAQETSADSHGHAQGGEPPPDARDPHAYAHGMTLTQGPYVLTGSAHHLAHADQRLFATVLFDRFEYNIEQDTGEYEFQASYGKTYNRLVLKGEAEIVDLDFEHSQTDILWGHAITAYFDRQLGVRLDTFDHGQNRQWLAVGVQGLLPYWFEVDVTGYLGTSGRSALAMEAEYELRLTQRLVLQPKAEVSFYGKDDEINGIGRGLSEVSLGVRLRYEIDRRFAPYIGVERSGLFGQTEDFAVASNEQTRSTDYVAGIKFWF